MVKECKRGLDHVSGKHPLKKQYHQGLKKSYALETEMKAKLYVQLCTEQAKIVEQRYTTQIFTQQETERCLKEQVDLPLLQAEKKAAFKKGCKKIKTTMRRMRASLYACMTGNTDIIKRFLKNTREFHTPFAEKFDTLFFKLSPLHIAAEHNQAQVIEVLGFYGVNFNRSNEQGELAIDLAAIQSNVEAFDALNVLEETTEALWVSVNKQDIEGLNLALLKGADVNATDEHGNTVLTLAISRQLDLNIMANLVRNKRAELNAQYTVEQKKEFINQHLDIQTKTFLLEHFVETEQQLITVQNDNVLLTEGPQWSDAHGWLAPHYHLTIKSIIAEVNGQKQLFVLGRSGAGIHLQSYDFITKRWITHPMGPLWSDQQGCAAEPYYSTIRLVVARVGGADQLFILMRNSNGIDLWRYDPRVLQWAQQPSGTDWSDQNGCATASYYSTIRLVVAQVDGTDQLFALMRLSNGVDLWRYDPLALQWTQQPSARNGSDQNGCAEAPYYSTLRLEVVPVEGKDQLFTLMRHSGGIDLWHYDPIALTWMQQPLKTHWSEGTIVPDFSIIRLAVARVRGKHGLFMLIRHAGGTDLLSYFHSDNQWALEPIGPKWSDEQGWSSACYQDTIQMQVVRGYDQSDMLLLFARSSAGIEAHVYNPALWSMAFFALPYSVPLIDAHGWNVAPYYSSIQIHGAYMQDEYKMLVLARSGTGIQCWSSILNVRLLHEHFFAKAQPFHTSAAIERLEEIEAIIFMANVNEASKSLLSAAEQGNWLGIYENLAKGADINGMNEQGYNALQVAIIAKKLSLDVLNVLIEAGIDLEHQTSQVESAVVLANQHMPEFTHLLSPEPVTGILKSLSKPLDSEAMKKNLQEHSQRAQRFLNKYPDDTQKIQAMLAYYAWLSKAEPYALYVMPALVMLSQLTEVINKAEASLPDELVKDFPKQKIFAAAQLFFKRTRAMHCMLIEMGPEAHTLVAKSEFMDFEWSYVSASIQLKREAIAVAKRLETNIHDEKVLEELCKTQHSLILKGTASTLGTFSKQVFGLDIVKPTDLENTAAEFLKYQEEHDGLLKAIVKQRMSKNMVEVVREASDSGLIQLPAKLSLKKALHEWEVSHNECKTNMEAAETELKLQNEALHGWLNQREAEYLARMEECDRHIHSTHLADIELGEQYNITLFELNRDLEGYRIDLKYNFEKAKHKIDSKFAKNGIAIIAALIIAPQLAPALTNSLGATLGVASAGSTMATLELMVEGALTGALSSGFSGNTKGILKSAFMGGWTAGLGSVLSGVLQKSTFITNMDKLFTTSLNAGQPIVTTTLVKAIQTLPASLEGGKLSANLLNSIGTTLVLGTSNELSFIEKLNTQFVSVVVSATVASLVTRSNFVQNVALLGMNTLLQSAGAHLGDHIAKARTAQTAPLELKKNILDNKASAASSPPLEEKVRADIPPARRSQPLQRPPSHGQGYHVPDDAVNAKGAQDYDRFIGTPQASTTTQNQGASGDTSLSKIPIYSVDNTRRTKDSNPILDLLFPPAYADELYESNSSRPSEVPNTSGLRKFFESIGNRGEGALSDDLLFVPGGAWGSLENPVVQDWSERFYSIHEEYHIGTRAIRGLQRFAGGAHISSDVAISSRGMDSAFELPIATRATQPSEVPNTSGLRKFFESIGSRGPGALSDDPMFVHGAWGSLETPVVQDLSERFYRINEEYHIGTRAVRGLQRFAGGAHISSDVAISSIGMDAAFALPMSTRSTQPSEVPNTSGLRTFFESIGNRGPGALSDDLMLVPGGAWGSLQNPVVQDLSERLYSMNEEYHLGTRAVRGLQRFAGGAHMSSDVAISSRGMDSAFGVPIAAMGADNDITGMKTFLAAEHQPTLQFNAARAVGSSRGLSGNQGYTPYASTVELTRKQEAFTDLNKTPDAYMSEKLVKEEIERDWSPIRSSFKLKGAVVKHGIDKRGRAYRKDPKTNYFSKSAYERRHEAEHNYGKLELRFKTKIHDIEIVDDLILDEFTQRLMFIDQDTSVGITGYRYEDLNYNSDIKTKKGIMKLEWIEGGGINILTSKTTTDYYVAQVDVNALDCEANATLSIDITGKENVSIIGKVTGVASVGSIKGEISSHAIEIGTIKTQCMALAEVHGPGIGGTLGGGINFDKKNLAGQIQSEVGLVTLYGGVMLKLQCSAKMNAPEENDRFSKVRPIGYVGR